MKTTRSSSPRSRRKTLEPAALAAVADDEEAGVGRTVATEREGAKRVMDTLLAAEAAGADEQEAIGETERGPRFRLRLGPEHGRVNAVRDDVDARRVEAVRTAGIGNLLVGGHDRLAVPENPPVRLGEMASRERSKATFLPEQVQQTPGTKLTLDARLDEADEVAVEHHDQGGRSLRAAPCELERARALPVNDVKRVLGVDSNERLV